jgi:hypothetical protein
MTLPRMLQAALDQRCVDGSLRVTQPLDNWRLEQPQGEAGLILNWRRRTALKLPLR